MSLDLALRLDSIDASLKPLLIAIAIVCFVVFGAGVVLHRTRRRLGLALLVAGGAPMAILVGAQLALAKAESSAAIYDMDQRLQSQVLRVALDGRTCGNPFLAATSFRRSALHPFEQTHSSALAPHRLKFETRTGTLELEVAQDSKYADRWWVFYPTLSVFAYEPFGPAVAYADARWVGAC